MKKIIIIIIIMIIIIVITTITIIIIITITLKGTIQDFLQPPHSAAKCLKHTRSSGQAQSCANHMQHID